MLRKMTDVDQEILEKKTNHRQSVRRKSDPAWKYALITFAVMRVFFSVWMWGIRQVFPGELPPNPVLRPYLDIRPEPNPMLEVWQRWDALHYQAIAERGYAAYDTALFSPPLFPMLIRQVNRIIGNTLIAGIIVSNAAFLVALVYWYRLVRLETNPVVARRSVLYLASFPTAFFFIAPYTESIYFLAAVLVFYSLQKENYITAGFWVAVGSLTRLPGFFLVIPLLYHFMKYWRSGDRRYRKLIPALLVGATGVMAYPLFVWLFLDLPPLTPFFVQAERFAGGFSVPGYNILQGFRQIFEGWFVVTNILDILAVLLFSTGLIIAWKRLRTDLVVYCAAILLLLLTRYSALQPLLSMVRYVLSLFPVLIIFAYWGERPVINRVYLYASWLISLYLSAQFALWGWVG